MNVYSVEISWKYIINTFLSQTATYSFYKRVSVNFVYLICRTNVPRRNRRPKNAFVKIVRYGRFRTAQCGARSTTIPRSQIRGYRKLTSRAIRTKKIEKNWSLLHTRIVT